MLCRKSHEFAINIAFFSHREEILTAAALSKSFFLFFKMKNYLLQKESIYKLGILSMTLKTSLNYHLKVQNFQQKYNTHPKKNSNLLNETIINNYG